MLAAGLAVLVVFRGPLGGLVSGPRAHTWTTVFVSVLVQAAPFLVFGVVLSTVIAVFVPQAFWARALTRHPGLAVPAAGLAGVVLPGCECGSVPIAGVADPARGDAGGGAGVPARGAGDQSDRVDGDRGGVPGTTRDGDRGGVAGLVVAVGMGWLWMRQEWIKLPHRSDLDDLSRWRAFWSACRHDILHAGGFLVVGAAAAAAINVLVPGSWLQSVAGRPVVSVIALALLAVLLSICSEADAFVAASLSQFSLTSRLVFLVVGQMVDLKLIAMQAGMFGRRFAFRFAPATLVAVIVVGAGFGAVLR
ncbi:permease [Actinoplanes sp. NPDC051411]|uniref:permease n=1 Tax=Actinoplanes sp. NPDC051411 TaxID=3155522 RepID=UPI003434108E